MLKICGLTRYFGGLLAVDSVDLSVSEGEIFGLIGPNGAGKSTLFNLISGLMTPNRGTIHFRNEDITKLKPHQRCRRGIGRTFQITQPLPHLTVLENVLVGACQVKMSLIEAEEHAYRMLMEVGLAKKALVSVDNLTVVDRKRLEIARALATEPRLLLLDEVMAGLNKSEVNKAIELFRMINAQGVTIVVIEHVMHAVMSISERIVVLEQGRKIAEGTPQEVATNPLVIEAYLGKEDALAGVN